MDDPANSLGADENVVGVNGEFGSFDFLFRVDELPPLAMAGLRVDVVELRTVVPDLERSDCHVLAVGTDVVRRELGMFRDHVRQRLLDVSHQVDESEDQSPECEEEEAEAGVC